MPGLILDYKRSAQAAVATARPKPPRKHERDKVDRRAVRPAAGRAAAPQKRT